MVKALSFCVVEASSKRAARREAAARWPMYVIGRACLTGTTWWIWGRGRKGGSGDGCS